MHNDVDSVEDSITPTTTTDISSNYFSSDSERVSAMSPGMLFSLSHEPFNLPHAYLNSCASHTYMILCHINTTLIFTSYYCVTFEVSCVSVPYQCRLWLKPLWFN